MHDAWLPHHNNWKAICYCHHVCPTQTLLGACLLPAMCALLKSMLGAYLLLEHT